MSRQLQEILSALAADAALWEDFNRLCDCGGRLAGSGSEQRALAFAHERLSRVDERGARIEPLSYAGWRLKHARLELADDGTVLACKPLLGSASTPQSGLAAEVIDLGRGTEEQFERHAKEIPGRIVLVRHEYPFTAGHLHRRRKLGWAMQHCAAGFIIANPVPGAGAVSGSSGRGAGAGIPAVSTDAESAAQLAPRGARLPRVRLELDGEDRRAETGIPILELPGKRDSWVVLSAHLDGHDLAESAMDNATGVATALAAARALAPHLARLRRGLKICLFSAEEWALAGSREYLDRMGEPERKTIVLNVNLDTVGGDARLTALVSGFTGLEAFVRRAAEEVGGRLACYRPLMPNSDHYNFARYGIPALRLVAGFDRPESNVRHILTAADTRDKVAPDELKSAALLTATLVWRAMNATDKELAQLR